MKFVKGAGKLRPILGTQTFVLASDPGFSFSDSLVGDATEDATWAGTDVGHKPDYMEADSRHLHDRCS